jgi:alanyl-tRNA synthetase
MILVMQSNEIRDKFLKFFEKRGHKIIPSASLVPENDSSTLFISAGMQPLVPYLLGQSHPQGTRLADCQKCVRTGDIDEVGDNTHLTFFEMLGNWSLGDYFKEEAIKWSWEFLTDKNEGLGLEPAKLYVTCFEGDDNAPRDEESAAIWRKLFISAGLNANQHIFFLPADKNWWSPGASGPCGPDTEMYYDVTENGVKIETLTDFKQADDAQEIVEVWNDVFMEFNRQLKKEKEVEAGKLFFEGLPIPKDFYEYRPLSQKNVDTGAGLERLAMVLQKKNNVFETDLFAPIMAKITGLSLCHSRAGGNLETESQNSNLDTGLRRYDNTEIIRIKRILTDHIRTAVFLIADGVIPSNTDRGYILRKILRRAIRYADILNLPADSLISLVEIIRTKYVGVYSNLTFQVETIKQEITKEETKFRLTLEKGLGVLNKEIKAQILKSGESSYELQSMNLIHGQDNSKIWDFLPAMVTGNWLFNFYQTLGFPPEMVIEELITKFGKYYLSSTKIKDLIGEFAVEMTKHQELSKSGSEERFKGGLGGDSEKIVKYHTATHLLQQALGDVLGASVAQKGSNITEERLRFDFAFDRKLTDEEKQKVEQIVNEKITANLPVNKIILPRDEAEKTGARHLFSEKYGDQVSIYFIGDSLENAYSKEFCGGPHTAGTGVLGHFKITKEEAVAAGVRRIKAVLE